MKKIKLYTQRIFREDWEYEIEVEDDFDINSKSQTYYFNLIDSEDIKGKLNDRWQEFDEGISVYVKEVKP